MYVCKNGRELLRGWRDEPGLDIEWQYSMWMLKNDAGAGKNMNSKSGRGVDGGM